MSFNRADGSAGDKFEVRVRAPIQARADPFAMLDEPLVLPDGRLTRLGALVQAEVEQGKGFTRHYNFKRSITVSAALDDVQVNPAAVDTRRANAMVREAWDAVRLQHPGVELDFSGEMEDIDESLDAMGLLFAMGVGLIYLILAAQFVSYWQPLMILVTVPLAFTGVAFGLALTGNPLSLFTLYGVIALTGIAVNSAIVLIDAANERRRVGMATVHAVTLAARRRVVPIVIKEINDRFLKVGYRKRDDRKAKKPKGRLPMGRKGIGKLALFSIANSIEVHSVKQDKHGKIVERNGFIMRATDIEESIKKKEHEYKPDPVSENRIKNKKGTLLTLRELKNEAKVTEAFLRRRLSRRFSVIGKSTGFVVRVNKKPITVEDRDYFNRLEYMWCVGEGSEEFLKQGKTQRHEQVSGTIDTAHRSGKIPPSPL